MKKIAVFGSTGSIGTQALEVLRKLEDFQLVSISCGKNIGFLEKQICEFNPKYICVVFLNFFSYLYRILNAS